MKKDDFERAVPMEFVRVFGSDVYSEVEVEKAQRDEEYQIYRKQTIEKIKNPQEMMKYLLLLQDYVQADQLYNYDEKGVKAINVQNVNKIFSRLVTAICRYRFESIDQMKDAKSIMEKRMETGCELTDDEWSLANKYVRFFACTFKMNSQEAAQYIKNIVKLRRKYFDLANSTPDPWQDICGGCQSNPDEDVAYDKYMGAKLQIDQLPEFESSKLATGQ